MTKIWTGCNHADSTLKLKNVSIECWYSQYDREGVSTLLTTEGFVSHDSVIRVLYCAHIPILTEGFGQRIAP